MKNIFLISALLCNLTLLLGMVCTHQTRSRALPWLMFGTAGGSGTVALGIVLYWQIMGGMPLPQ
ncbi:MAG: hypothetical protein JO142_08015 [Burkholderiales bacterium]|nr:hypothetical protein [Burkholderiales bacterium]